MTRLSNEPLQILAGNYQGAGVYQRMELKSLGVPQRLVNDQLYGTGRVIEDRKQGDGAGFYAQIFFKPVR